MINISTISLILLNNIYGIDRKQKQMPISKELLIKHSSGFSDTEIEECLSELKASAYIDVSEQGIIITEKGISLIRNNRLIKIAKAIIITIWNTRNGVLFLCHKLISSE